MWFVLMSACSLSLAPQESAEAGPSATRRTVTAEELMAVTGVAKVGAPWPALQSSLEARLGPGGHFGIDTFRWAAVDGADCVFFEVKTDFDGKAVTAVIDPVRMTPADGWFSGCMDYTKP